MSGPYSITVAAAATIDLQHRAGATVSLPVADSGTRPLQVRLTIRDVTKPAQQYPGASWVHIVGPASFTLKPHQTRMVTLRVRVPPGARGTHYANFIATAGPPDGSAAPGFGGHVVISGGGTLHLIQPGHVAALAVASPPPAPKLPPPGSDMTGAITALAVLLGLLAGVTILAARRFFRGRPDRVTAIPRQ